MAERAIGDVLIDNLFEFLNEGTEQSKDCLADFAAAGIIKFDTLVTSVSAPTPCPNCGEVVEFDSMRRDPRGGSRLVCGECRELLAEETEEGA